MSQMMDRKYKIFKWMILKIKVRQRLVRCLAEVYVKQIKFAPSCFLQIVMIILTKNVTALFIARKC